MACDIFDHVAFEETEFVRYDVIPWLYRLFLIMVAADLSFINIAHVTILSVYEDIRSPHCLLPTDIHKWNKTVRLVVLQYYILFFRGVIGPLVYGVLTILDGFSYYSPMTNLLASSI